MKRIFISLVALLSMTIVSHAANLVSPLSKTQLSKNLGKKADTIPTFKLGPVTFTTDNSGATNYKNGWMRNDSSWTIYRDFGDGPLNVKADEGYWIKDLTMTYYENSLGILSTVAGGGQSKNPLLASNYPILFNGTERQFYVGKTKTDGGGFLCISKFVVSYFAYPTSMTMEDMTISVGNQFQVIPTFSPANSFAWCDWESDNTNVVTVDKNGVILAKAAGTANITATYGSLSTSCKITVVTTDDESLYDDFQEYGTSTAFNKNASGKQTSTGLWWILRNWQRSATTDTINGIQGTQIQYIVSGSNKNYFAYDNSKPMEGGVKRVSFQWRAVDSTKNVMFNLDDCTNNPIAFYTFLPAGKENVEVHTLTQDINQAKNYQFRLRISDQASSNIVFGPITITPYLYYKTKTAEVNGKFTNKDLINNTPDTATVVYTLEGNDGEASIDAATGEVTCLAEGEVTVRATWGAVSTTYTLKTHILQIPEISFEADTLNKDIYDAPFTNLLTTTPGVGDTTYTSSDTTVATIDAKGKVTIKAGGTTIITASIAANATYAAKSASYVLNVDFKPAEGAFWRETFNSVPQGQNFSGTDKYVGDSSVYNWAMTYYQRLTDDMVGDYQGTRIRYSGALAMDGVQEGGIKAIRFDYRAANQVNPIHFKVNVDGTDYEYNHAALPVRGTIVTYAQKIEVKKNTQFSINMDAEHKPSQAYPIFGPITIAPYLLYTVKTASIDLADTTSYKNTNLIDNRDNEQAITYSILEGEGAEVDANGVVTASVAGTYTVQAAWGDVATTYVLTVTGTATNLNNLNAELEGAKKVMINNQLYILRNAQLYDVQGNLINK